MKITNSLTKVIGSNLNQITIPLPFKKNINPITSLNKMAKKIYTSIPTVTEKKIVTGTVKHGKNLLKHLVMRGVKKMVNNSMDDLLKSLDAKTINNIHDIAKNISIPNASTNNTVDSSEITNNVMNQMLNNPEMTKLATETMKEILKDQNTVNQLKSVLSDLLSDNSNK
ncbi:hypothetical protein ACQKCU_20040 [Heyndrickxia sporothermodurans]